MDLPALTNTAIGALSGLPRGLGWGTSGTAARRGRESRDRWTRQAESAFLILDVRRMIRVAERGTGHVSFQIAVQIGIVGGEDKGRRAFDQ